MGHGRAGTVPGDHLGVLPRRGGRAARVRHRQALVVRKRGALAQGAARPRRPEYCDYAGGQQVGPEAPARGEHRRGHQTGVPRLCLRKGPRLCRCPFHGIWHRRDRSDATSASPPQHAQPRRVPPGLGGRLLRGLVPVAAHPRRCCPGQRLSRRPVPAVVRPPPGAKPLARVARRALLARRVGVGSPPAPRLRPRLGARPHPPPAILRAHHLAGHSRGTVPLTPHQRRAGRLATGSSHRAGSRAPPAGTSKPAPRDNIYSLLLITCRHWACAESPPPPLGAHVQLQRAGIQEDTVVAAGDLLSNVACRLNSPQLDEARVVLHGVADEFGAAGLALRADDGGLFVLQRLLHQEAAALSLLLRHLLGLYGRGVLLAKRQVRDGDVVEEDVEVFGALDEVALDQPRHLFALRDQLRRIKLGHHRLGHLVHNRRQHPLVIVQSQRLINGR
eukprot:ctg_2168.g342